jgi:ABC-type lipoprotein export system ATPase subunit
MVTVKDASGAQRSCAEAIAWIVQSEGLFRRRTALSNVMLGTMRALWNCAEDEIRAREALDQVGLAKLASRTVRSLSGGEAKRVAIARALVMNKQFIFADEPTAQLDHRATRTVLDSLFEHRRSGLVVATHDPAVVERCDNAIELTRFASSK